MKKYLPIAYAAIPLVAILAALSACHPEPRSQHHVAEERVYHMADGRYAYMNNGVWFYLMMQQAGSSSSAPTTTYVTAPAGTPVSTVTSATNAAWAKGQKPTDDELEEAEQEQVAIEENANGAPVAPEEAAEPEPQTETLSEPATETVSSDSSASDSGGSADSGGGASE